MSVLALLTLGIGNAQAVTVQESLVYSFPLITLTDGSQPISEPIIGADGNLYGVTFCGGSHDNGGGQFNDSNCGDGIVYKLTPAGSETVLHAFGATVAAGTHPQGALLKASDGNFYGTTVYGGESDYNVFHRGEGTVYRLTPAGVHTVLHSFGVADGDGSFPAHPLVQALDGFLYGTADGGNDPGYGVVYRIRPDGTGYAVVHAFGPAPEGSGPSSPLTVGADGALYGVTRYGGTYGKGTVYRVTTGGSYRRLYSFGGCAADTEDPAGALALGTDGNLYGTAYGSYVDGERGAAFVVTPSGVEAVIHEFAPDPSGGAMLAIGLRRGAGGNFFGSTFFGGDPDADEGWITGGDGGGIVYMLGPDGTFTSLHEFAGASADGLFAVGVPTEAADGTLYGVTQAGGASDRGAVYKLTKTGVPAAAYPASVTATCPVVDGGGGGSGGGSLALVPLLLLGGLALRRR